jgi:hypothetical protein
LVGVAGIAQAEEPVVLASVSPGVLVNQGDMYMPAEAGMELTTGDQVMVLESGEAQITYADGCQQQLGENQVMQIADVSTCPQVATTGSTAGLGLATAPAAGSVTGTAMGATFAGASSTTTILVTAAAAGTVVAVGQAAENDDDDRATPPASP